MFDLLMLLNVDFLVLQSRKNTLCILLYPQCTQQTPPSKVYTLLLLSCKAEQWKYDTECALTTTNSFVTVMCRNKEDAYAECRASCSIRRIIRFPDFQVETDGLSPQGLLKAKAGMLLELRKSLSSLEQYDSPTCK